MRMRYSKHGFTLIELIIVIVIIGILASIAAPMMQGAKEKAVLSEALMIMGNVRTALRQYYVEYSAWPPGTRTNVSDMDDAYVASHFPGLTLNSFEGTYFSKESFVINPWSGVLSYVRKGNSSLISLNLGDNAFAYILMTTKSGKMYQKDYPKTKYTPMGGGWPED